MGLDVALELQNPFDVSVSQGQDFFILGVDTGIPNPGSDALAIFEGVQQVGVNLVQDLSALAFRVFFVIIGLAILTAIGQQVVSQSNQENANKLGGVQGITQLVGAIA